VSIRAGISGQARIFYEIPNDNGSRPESQSGRKVYAGNDLRRFEWLAFLRDNGFFAARTIKFHPAGQVLEMPLLNMSAKQDLAAGSHRWASDCPNFGLIHAATN
jgi:hypothetical protein